MKDIDEFEINRRFKELREYEGLTRDEIAIKTGIKSGQIASIENERQKMPAWYIEAVKNCFPEYVYWFATGDTLPEAGQISPELEETRRNLSKAG